MGWSLFNSKYTLVEIYIYIYHLLLDSFYHKCLIFDIKTMSVNSLRGGSLLRGGSELVSKWITLQIIFFSVDSLSVGQHQQYHLYCS